MSNILALVAFALNHFVKTATDPQTDVTSAPLEVWQSVNKQSDLSLHSDKQKNWQNINMGLFVSKVEIQIEIRILCTIWPHL